MAKGFSQPGQIHIRIIDVMKRFPEGISGGQIRQELEKEGLRPEDQTHLDRRKRDLKKWFIIEKMKSTVIVEGKKRNVTLYRYEGKRQRVTDEGQISQRLRAEVIHSAHGRCRMCGKTIEEHRCFRPHRFGKVSWTGRAPWRRKSANPEKSTFGSLRS
jgi:hypothetical protein